MPLYIQHIITGDHIYKYFCTWPTCLMCRHEPWDGGKASYCLMGTDLLFGMIRKCWKWIVVIVAQHCMYLMLLNCTLKNGWHRDFPGGAVDKSLGRCHMPRNNWACVPQLLYSRAREPQILSQCAKVLKPLCRASAPQQEKPLHWEARTLQWRVAPVFRN